MFLEFQSVLRLLWERQRSGNSFLKYELRGIVDIDERLVEYQGSLYFAAAGDGETGIQLWKYNDTEGAVRVTDISLDTGGILPSGLTVFNSELYFYGGNTAVFPP